MSDRLDLVIAVDKSNQMSIKIMEKLKTFLRNMIESYDISQQNVRISLLTFGGGPRILINLKNGVTKDKVINAINNIGQPGKRIFLIAIMYFVIRNN